MSLKFKAPADTIHLTAKPHAFSGAVLPPKHAHELTPQQCLAMVTALAEQQRKTVVPYTVWITEAWRVLGWAEPSAALFWEMATMYHALYWKSRTAEDMEKGFPPILTCGSNASLASTHNSMDRSSIDKRRMSASAKELPVWLVGTFLLLHCEERAKQRFWSGEDEAMQRHLDLDNGSTASHASRSTIHAGWTNDHHHCTAFLLKHLRKFLILLAVPDNQDAVRACLHLAALPPTPAAAAADSNSATAATLRRQHDKEHGNVGLKICLQLEDLERLLLILQVPRGGALDDPPLSISSLIWSSLFKSDIHPAATILLGDVEQELRRHLEWDLGQELSPDDDDAARSALAKLVIQEQKELNYHRLRSKTILLKPENISSGASLNSGEAAKERTHDLSISECSDAHFYLLQPFEHATIVGCTNCTIVIGALAGLLHVVDCEKTSITCAARRVLVSNCCDVQVYLFSPTPPLLVGDNRSCQFAPYNSYYEGFRDDLVTAGLAVVAGGDTSSQLTPMDGGWPALQTASNKWKQPIELAKLEIPQIPGSPLNSHLGGSPTNAAADDKAMESTNMPTPVLLPASDFNILYVPSKIRETEDEEDTSQYCRFLADVLHLSPFRLPVEYERRVLMKAERMKNVQAALKSLNTEQRSQLEEELNHGFREWLVTSGNLRQVLDLVYMEQVR